MLCLIRITQGLSPGNITHDSRHHNRRMQSCHRDQATAKHILQEELENEACDKGEREREREKGREKKRTRVDIQSITFP